MPALRGPSVGVGFDGTLIDYSGNGNDGQINGPTGIFPALGVPGLVTGDTALRLGAEGSEFYSEVDVPAAVVGGPFQLAGDFSVELWLASDAPQETFSLTLPTGSDLILCRANSLDVSPAGLRFSCAINMNKLTDPLVGFPFDGARHHLAFVVSGDEGFIYLDGDSVPVNQDPTNGGDPQFRGGDSDYSFHTTTDNRGVIDELAIYEHALSGGSVAAHYAARNDFGDYTAAVLSDSPAGYYHLNEVGPDDEDETRGWFIGSVVMG